MKDKHDFKNKIEQSTQEDENPQNLLQKFQATPVLLLSLMAGCAVALVVDVGC